MFDSAYPLDAAFRWTPTLRSSPDEAGERAEISDVGDALTSIHPVYAIPWDAVERTRSFFTAKVGF